MKIITDGNLVSLFMKSNSQKIFAQIISGPRYVKGRQKTDDIQSYEEVVELLSENIGLPTSTLEERLQNAHEVLCNIGWDIEQFKERYA